MNFDWGTLFNDGDVHVATKAFCDKLFYLFETYIPHRDNIVKPSNDMPWFNRRIKADINKRDKL
jgi:hypothetical protein